MGFDNRLKTGGLAVAVLAASLSTVDVRAENWADRINISGFATAKYQQIDEDNKFNGEDGSGIEKDGSWDGTKVGINLTAPVDEKISVATQFFASNEGGNYALTLDWGFVSYSFSDEVTLRTGKIKFPVGLVNEYVDVGNAYPWITPPELFYTEVAAGPNITREAYTGLSALWGAEYGDTEVNVDIFGGEIALDSMNLHKLIGAKFSIAWNETVTFQTSYYQGTMRDTSMAAMEGKKHSNVAVGLSLDWNDIVGYAEWADTDMETEIMNGSSWYTTWGYQMGDWLPHLTYQYFEIGEKSTSPQEQNMTTAGLRYDLSDVADLKFEYSIINTEKGQGLFENAPVDDSTNR